jgi:hypothetical protein
MPCLRFNKHPRNRTHIYKPPQGRCWLYQNNLDCIKKDSFAFDYLTDVYTFAITYKIAELADNAIDNLIYFHSLKSDWLHLMNLIDTWAKTPQGLQIGALYCNRHSISNRS